MDNPQGELFTQSLDNGQFKGRKAGVSFFTRIRGYEKATLLIMFLVLASIVSFSLGVEKGKRAAFSPYTIQVAVFKNRESAAREVLLLAKKGFTPLAFTKGDYIILCVGKFSNQESAQPLLSQLQRTYAGCRIRRL
ncbi:MAG: SPOR domain-containing protein [Candidatus Omnitrophota bacterium]